MAEIAPVIRTFAWWRDRVDGFGKESCWSWRKALSTAGYGIVNRLQGEYYAHRLSYRVFIGDIPEGLQMDHLCRNRRCVNPSHLEAVTQHVNLARGTSLSAANAARTHCNRGHAFTEDNIYRCATRPGTRICRRCALAKTIRARESSIASGLCVRCNEPASVNRTMCAQCRQIESKATIARRKRNG